METITFLRGDALDFKQILLYINYKQSKNKLRLKGVIGLNAKLPIPSQEYFLQQLKNFCLMDDDFLTKVFEDRACAQLLLQIILERNDLQIKKVQTQRELKNLQGRSVRLDIYAVDQTGRHYNIEIQRRDQGALPQRARYNLSLMDANLSFPGEAFRQLPETYVIFITENDVLGGNLPLYHVERTVQEMNTAFPDGTHIIYVNSQIQDETALGLLMQDFYRTSADKMNYPVLANRVRYFKQEEEGVFTMCKAMEEMCDMVAKNAAKYAAAETNRNAALRMLQFGDSTDKVAAILGLSLAEVQELQKQLAQQ